MPKFHFIICTSYEMIGDRRGRTLDNLSNAVELASRYARLLIVKARYEQIDFKVIEVRDERGWLLATVRFQDANPSYQYHRKPIEAPICESKSSPSAASQPPSPRAERWNKAAAREGGVFVARP